LALAGRRVFLFPAPSRVAAFRAARTLYCTSLR
jgi:hypothetical protein